MHTHMHTHRHTHAGLFGKSSEIWQTKINRTSPLYNNYLVLLSHTAVGSNTLEIQSGFWADLC